MGCFGGAVEGIGMCVGAIEVQGGGAGKDILHLPTFRKESASHDGLSQQ